MSKQPKSLGLYSWLKFDSRKQTRLIGRDLYMTKALSVWASLEDSEIRAIAKQRLVKRHAFRGVTKSIWIAIATRLITELIKQWVINNVFTPSFTYQPNEPGYESSSK
ncbi:hypothetical protein [Roseiconus lacunae]|uniref:hypothetical protein n=1 Tax=Roseiconus lacunae TaxID=2605694 RepID=UPI0011F0B34E|nr:hypothetical protein [Roseiconus lacunae]